MTIEDRITSMGFMRFTFFMIGLLYITNGGAAVAFAAFYWDLIDE